MGKRKDKRSGDLKLRRERLKELIDRLDVRYEDFATLTKYSLSTISRMICGTKDISDINIDRIIYYLTSEELAQRIEKYKLEINIVKLIATIEKLELNRDYFDEEKIQYDGKLGANKTDIVKADSIEMSPSIHTMEHKLIDGVDFRDKLIDKYKNLANLEKYYSAANFSSEVIAYITCMYIKTHGVFYPYVPTDGQMLIYSNRTSSAFKIPERDYVQRRMYKFVPLRCTPILLEVSGNLLRKERNTYWTNELDHLKSQLGEHIDNIIKWNKISTLHVFTIAPQPLVVQLGYLLNDISNVEIHQPRIIDNLWMTWDWEESYEILHYLSYEPETKKDIVVLNLSLSTLIKKSMIERVLGSELSIWTLTIEEPRENFLDTKKELINFKVCFRDFLDKILDKHGKHISLHVFLSVPIAIAFEIGRLWNPNTDPELKLYGLSSESGDYYEIYTIKKNE